MNKIDIISKVQGLIKVRKPSPKLKSPKDSFQKAEQSTTNPEVLHTTKILSRADFKEFSEELINNQYWSNSCDFVSLNIKDKTIENVSIGIFHPEEAKTHKYKLSVPEFISMYTQIAANNMEHSPKNEKEYKKCFVNFIKYINGKTE